MPDAVRARRVVRPVSCASLPEKPSRLVRARASGRRCRPPRRQYRDSTAHVAPTPHAAYDGKTEWSSAEIGAGLDALTLGPDAPLSCLVVETLPGESPYSDPLGGDLGDERFLRTSPLTAVPGIC